MFYLTVTILLASLRPIYKNNSYKHPWYVSNIFSAPQGRLYSFIGPLQAPEGQRPTFAQIYISDPTCDHPQAEAEIRLGHVRLPPSTTGVNQRRLLALMQELQILLREENPLVRDFLCANEVLSTNVEHRELVISAAARPTGEHARRYNAAEGFREVSVLMTDEPGNRDIVLRHRHQNGQNLQRVSLYHRHYEALHFVLLFPNSYNGWHENMLQNVSIFKHICDKI